MPEIVGRWEWRTFGTDFGAAEAIFASLEVDRIDDSNELYVLATASDASVKVRDGLMDVKRLQGILDDGLEQWVPVVKTAFPLAATDLDVVIEGLHSAAAPRHRPSYTLDEFVDDIVRPSDDLLAVEVHKHRARYTVGGCLAEISTVGTGDGTSRTIAVESEDPELVRQVVRSLGLASRPNTCMARGLKTLVGFGTSRYAVIDVGTNSIKLHVGERHADGTWSTVSDRAEVTRLGEGLDATGRIQPEPMKRTIDAIAAMADESRSLGVRAIASVGTAGLRAAANSDEVLRAVDARCGVQIEIISGEEEGRLAYLAAKSGLGLARGSLCVFDSGGGSSQFSFGHDDEVDERFSVAVGAVRLTDQHGLGGIVSAEALAVALDDIAAELHTLDSRSAPDTLIGMGGAVTNLAAVKHELRAYDADVVQGTRLDRAEIDRQIELYRTRSADDRRAIVGLQPNRAEVILAGACVARTVLTKLDRESLVVSDRGLRHGLIVDRFGIGPPVG